MKKNLLFVVMGIFLLTACSITISTPSTLPTPLAPTQAALDTVKPTLTHTETSIPPLATQTTELSTPTPTPTFPPPSTALNICTDPRVPDLINSFKTAVLTADGVLLSSLVSPAHGMDARYFRDGKVVNYKPEQAKFLFETTFEVNWGADPGSGEDKIGSFHDVIVPKLVSIFEGYYQLHCNQLVYGGASYNVTWPYAGDYYSVYFPGSEQYGYLDWHTWVIGIEYVDGKPYIYAIMQFFWEP
ncbi:MAG TPA: hypothetical protein VNK49_13310 [Anaerolineales bacterium]|nr:hypothetical protein [Anaerolineales bacterium]